MFLSNTAIFYFVLFLEQTRSLNELPQVDDNNMLVTEAAIRHTTNTLFDSLRLKDIKNKPRLKEYATVHNSLISFALQDYKNLKEIAKLTRVDRNKINNETANFMAVINELLNEDIAADVKEHVDAGEESVVEYVDQFLTNLEGFKEQYGVNTKNFHINKDVYQALKDDDVASYNYTMDSVSEIAENDTLLNESEFWKPEPQTRRIYHGDRTKIKHYPFMASIQIFNKFHCGGSIITSDLVITASSCLQLAWNNRFFRENPAFLSVRVGSTFYNGGGENIPVLEVYFHPEYNPKNLWNNLCVLRLIRRLNFRKRTKQIKKIEFDRKESNLPMTTDGITILGWGAKGTSNMVKNPWANTLAVAVLDIYPLRECQDIYSKEYVTKKNFCAGFFSKGGGACNHDVGGPGIVSGTLTGVVSFGSPVCGTPDAPTVFTKIGYYADWIEEIMEMEVPNIQQRTTEKVKYDFYTINVRPQTTTFKIPPLAGKLKPIPISEVDALRMLTNDKLFKEFLSTMFHKKEAVEYQELFEGGGPQLEPNIAVEDKANDIISLIDATGKVPVEPIAEYMPDGHIITTDMVNFDPEVINYNQDDHEASTTPTNAEAMFMNDQDENFKAGAVFAELAMVPENEDGLEDVDKHGLMTIDKHLKGLNEIDKQIDELVNKEASKNELELVENGDSDVNIDNGTKVNKDKQLEKDLVNLIDDIDLKEIIDTMPSVEEDKLAVDEKVIKLFQDKGAQKRVEPVDDSVLTLLYLSSSEKNTKNRDDGLSLMPDYVEDENGDDNEESKGISIEARDFKDFTYRNRDNVTNIIEKLTREEIESLLAKHLQHLQPNDW